MESRFGYDFGRIRIHRDTKGAESARSVDALAYTVGQDIIFGEGQWAPDTKRGGRLLAHELAHVVQQDKYSVEQLQRQSAEVSSARCPYFSIRVGTP